MKERRKGEERNERKKKKQRQKKTQPPPPPPASPPPHPPTPQKKETIWEWYFIRALQQNKRRKKKKKKKKRDGDALKYLRRSGRQCVHYLQTRFSQCCVACVTEALVGIAKANILHSLLQFREYREKNMCASTDITETKICAVWFRMQFTEVLWWKGIAQILTNAFNISKETQGHFSFKKSNKERITCKINQHNAK